MTLTLEGERVALEVIRHHRLLELYLAETLGIDVDEVHDEADRLEHALSEELEARIDEALGFPTVDPHGDPIPDRALRIATITSRTVADLDLGDTAVVARVPDGNAELLRYLAGIALVPGEALELTGSAPFDGPLTVKTGNGEHAIARELAGSIGIA